MGALVHETSAVHRSPISFGCRWIELLPSVQRAFESHSHQLAASLHASLAEQSLHYILNVTFGEAHVVANLPIGKAAQNSQKHFPLAVFQRTAKLLILKRRVPIDQLINQELE